ncbi:hypothetical protein SLA2020_041050 [Shorea laevis]
MFTLGLNESLVPTVECLAILGTKWSEVTFAITRFPHALPYGGGETLPVVGCLPKIRGARKAIGEDDITKSKLISYHIVSKLIKIMEDLTALGRRGEGMIGSPGETAIYNGV